MRIGAESSFRFGLASLERRRAEIDQALERLSTGRRINRASDDPSGLMAADEMRFDMTRLEKLIENTEYGMAMAGAREGALSVVSDQLIELQGLVVASANRGARSAEEREAMQIQVDEIIKNLQRMENTTTFRGEQILRGFGPSGLGVVEGEAPEGAPAGEGQSYSLLSLQSGGALNLVDGDPALAQRVIDAAVDGVARARAGIGAHVQSLESKANVWRTELTELAGAHSLIMDADYAAETAKLFRGRLLEQAAISAIQISRDSAERALELLQSATGAAEKA